MGKSSLLFSLAAALTIVPVSYFGLPAAQAQRDVFRDRAILAGPDIAVLSTEPAQAGEIETLDPADPGPGRIEDCKTTCRIVDGNRETTTICRPFVVDPDADGPLSRARMERISPAGPARGINRAAMLREPITPVSRYTLRRDGMVELQPEASQCPRVAHLMSTVPRPTTSPRCWVSAVAYCKYQPQGRLGYPCNCGQRAGYFN